jgi:hypothetical protein
MQNEFDETIPNRSERELDDSTFDLSDTVRSPRIENELENTQASAPVEDGEQEYQILRLEDDESPGEGQTEETRVKKKRRWIRWVGVGFLGFFLLIALGAVSGYMSGQGMRANQATQNAAVEAVMQFQLGLEDLNAGLCDIALQRFLYVAQVNPNYPELQDKLVAAQLCSQATTTPTAIFTPTVTPTQDTRDVEDKFSEAQALLAAEDWSNLLATLDSLRDNHPDYMPIEVDRMYYIALRNRGVNRILVQGDLEGGIFDLNLAEKYGLIDVEARSYREWASWYISGVSYWDVDWGQAISYFGQIAIVAPNLWDGSYYAHERLATAQVGYSYELIKQANYLLTVKGWCDADDLYREAASYQALDPTVQPTAEYAAVKCELNPDEGPEE